MHPVIQFSCFFSLIIGLTLAAWPFFLITSSLLAGLYWRYGKIAPLQRALLRLRWLLLSLFILYAWFSRPDWQWLPEWAGLALALERVSALIVIVVAANLLVQVNTTAQLIATLQWYLLPLQSLGMPTQLVAVRLALVLDTLQTIEQLQTPVTMPPAVEFDTSATRWTKIRYTMHTNSQHISRHFIELFQRVLNHAEQTPLRVLTLPTLTAPPWWQWGYPLSLALLMGGLT